MKYDLPPEVLVEEDGPVRIVILNRPESLNSVNEGLHHGIASVWRQIAADPDARAAVLTGAGSAAGRRPSAPRDPETDSAAGPPASPCRPARRIRVEVQ